MANKALTGGGVAVRIYEPSCGRVIITGLEVIEAAFGIVVVATVAEGVLVGQFTGGGQDLAVGVVGVGRLALMPFPPQQTQTLYIAHQKDYLLL